MAIQAPGLVGWGEVSGEAALKVTQLGFAFVLGLAVGGSGALALFTPVREDTEVAPAETVPQRPRTERRAAREQVSLPEDSGDPVLAENLGRAQFDRDWARVAEVARILRARGRRRRALGAARSGAGGGPSLLLLDHEYRRKAFLLQLRERVTPAADAAREDLPVAERERRLRDLLFAPRVGPDAEAARRDAAYHLGLLGTAAGREALARAFEESDPGLARLAAEALARSEDPEAIGVLVEALRSAIDPARRALAAEALAWTRDAALGGPVARELARAARSDRSRAVRAHAIASLALVDLDRCVPAREALVSLLADPVEDAELRRAAVASLRAHWAIARALPGELLVALERALLPSTGALRAEVVEALAEAGRAETVAVLERALFASKDATERGLLERAIASIRERTRSR